MPCGGPRSTPTHPEHSKNPCGSVRHPESAIRKIRRAAAATAQTFSRLFDPTGGAQKTNFSRNNLCYSNELRAFPHCPPAPMRSAYRIRPSAVSHCHLMGWRFRVDSKPSSGFQIQNCFWEIRSSFDSNSRNTTVDVSHTRCNSSFESSILTSKWALSSEPEPEQNALSKTAVPESLVAGEIRQRYAPLLRAFGDVRQSDFVKLVRVVLYHATREPAGRRFHCVQWNAKPRN